MTLAVIALLATAFQPQGDPSRELTAARARWERAAIKHYQFTVHVGWFKGQLTQSFRVWDGKHAHALSGLDTTAAATLEQYNTVEKIFSNIAGVLANPGGRVSVKYDREYGYPIIAGLDFNVRINDEERSVQITEFVPLPHPMRGELPAISSAASAAIQSAKRILGESAASMMQVFRREPDRSELTAVQDTQTNLPNGQLRMDYGGLVATIVIFSLNNSSALRVCDVTDVQWLEKLGFGLPLDRAEARRKFGQPTLETPTQLYYEEPGDVGEWSMRLWFENGRLTRASWFYVWD